MCECVSDILKIAESAEGGMEHVFIKFQMELTRCKYGRGGGGGRHGEGREKKEQITHNNNSYFELSISI